MIQPAKTSKWKAKGPWQAGVTKPLLIGLMVCLGAGGAWVAVRGTGGPKHHVVLVIIDTLRQDSLSCYGNARPTSPHIDALAKDGVRFDQAVSSSGWTLPAISSILTGAWPTIHGALGKKTRLTPIRDELPTGAEILKEEGFATTAFANAAFVSPWLKLDRGFDSFDHMPAFNYEIRRADETIKAALGKLKGQLDRSTFTLIHLFDAHLNYDPPKDYGGKFTDREVPSPYGLTMQQCKYWTVGGVKPEDPSTPVPAPSEEDIDYMRAVYDAEINFVDDQIGRLVAELKRMGIYDRTTIVITSDHGEEFWEHDGFEHGHTLYEELVRVPLIVKFPAEVGVRGKVIDAQVSTLTIMPTVFELVGVEQPDSFVGRSVLPLSKGESKEDHFAFSEGTLYGADKIAWREPPYKFIFDLSPEAEVKAELYNLDNDPGEQTNLVDSERETAMRLRKALFDFYGELRDRAERMSKPLAQDLSPAAVREAFHQLRDLGYTGEDR
jgi:arylsulfatase A-like enzyme